LPRFQQLSGLEHTHKEGVFMKQTLLDALVVVMLVAFAGIGIANVFKPNYFIRRSGVRKGRRIADGVEPTRFSVRRSRFRWLRDLPFVRCFSMMSDIAW
jgi:hypothetical protein